MYVACAFIAKLSKPVKTANFKKLHLKKNLYHLRKKYTAALTLTLVAFKMSTVGNVFLFRGVCTWYCYDRWLPLIFMLTFFLHEVCNILSFSKENGEYNSLLIFFYAVISLGMYREAVLPSQWTWTFITHTVQYFN